MTEKEKAVITAAIMFITHPEIQEALQELVGTQSMDAPIEFMELGETVRELQASDPTVWGLIRNPLA